MHRIIIPLYDRTSDSEVDEILSDIKGIGLDDARQVRLPELHTTEARAAAREKVWAASQAHEGVTLTADEVSVLWLSVLQDSIASAALRG